MFWSQTVLPGKPRLLLVDASRNLEGWEAEFADRLRHVLTRKGIEVVGEAPVCAPHPEDLDVHLARQAAFNSILLFGHGSGHDVPEDLRLQHYWTRLNHGADLGPKLLALCTCETPDLQLSQEVLDARTSFARLALAPQTSLSPRVAGLFFMKFFAELDLHSSNDTVTGKMVWFSYAKAKLLLERRAYPGQIGVRC